MTYNPSIPQENDLISVSQSQLLQNFGQLNTQFGVDHTAFDAGSQNGKHKKSTYIQQMSDPATLSDEISIYNKISTSSSLLQLFLRRESNGEIIPWTERKINSTVQGWCFLPSGILLTWDQAQKSGNDTVDLTVIAGHPGYSTIFQVLTQIIDPTNMGNDPNAAIYTYNLNAVPNKFQVNVVQRTSAGSASNKVFQFLVIGIP